MNQDPFHLSRFVDVQATAYASALRELQAGRKQSHWIWFVFPQLRGLGHSTMARLYGLASLAEAQALLAHPLLGSRLQESVQAMRGHRSAGAARVLGAVDAMKFRSCLTLFARAAGPGSVYAQALAEFFDGDEDPLTLALLAPAQGDDRTNPP